MILARVSHSVSLADYRAALRTRGAAAPVLTSLLARLPVAMIGLALLLYVQRVTGSFGVAGLVSAGNLVGVAVGSVVQGRIMDRLGPTRPLLVVSAVFTGFVAAEIAAVELGGAAVPMIVLAVAVGLTEPMTGPASRALWTRLLPPGRTRDAAYSYEAISMEVFFILGPGIAGLLVNTPWAGTGLLVGACCMVTGSIGFALTPAARRHRPVERSDAVGSLLGALAAPGMRTVALAAFGFGALLGMVEVAVPAAAERAGHAALGGLLLSVLSVSSVVVGVLYGMRPWPRPMYLRLPALLSVFAVLIALLALPETLLGLTVALLVAGTLITPQSTAHSVALEGAAPPGTATEAFSWVITAVTLGSAFGQSVSGQLVELAAPPTAFLVASGIGLVLGALLWFRRRTLLTEDDPRPVPSFAETR
ncbi:Predicted arabinose efflux permease, MFS family [Actinopolyspora lacussalsi subsp. righensis]|uniref:Predicted arabinose efflux permease, MFS family n=1 Tax=Actinopolyspora righensis TaxID=995060 RepID=A0A1I7BQE7_9ACTN|nr:Predicted arabinose efflux permease, MFS family [Actinopolyspora righensis]